MPKTADVNTDKIRNATDAATVISWRCSCGEQRDSMDDLGIHQAETAHSGMWMMDGETEVEVDGERAILKKGPLREQLNETFERPDYRDPPVPNEWVLAAQKAIDENEHQLGGLTAGKKCPGVELIDGVEVPCPHITAMRTVRINTCNLEHKHSETLFQLCLIHGLRYLAAGLSPAGNGPLFENA